MKKTKIVRKSKVPKTRNNGTMTEAVFFSWLRQILRKSSVCWKPISQVRKDAQVSYTGLNKRRRFSYVCSECEKEFAITDIKVHHIIECGELRTFEDLSEFARRLFVEKEGLRVVCNKCHDKIHKK